MRFTGVLLKPLDRQFDQDFVHIDPQGVRIYEDAVPLVIEFDNSKIIGQCHVSRAEDGSLVVDGTIFDEAPLDDMKLAIGVRARESIRNRTKDQQVTLAECDLMAISLTRHHVDPEQPAITVIRE